ncbi:MAG: electron transport complex subunit RsxC, partial [Halioglobus sp.]|nr:electron transport complex subunit RsxC [Halioglobus sp.]
TKLEAAQQALADYHAANSSAAGNTAQPVEAAQAAIEKAMAARAAEASLSPQEKAQANLDKLRGRLEKSRARLAESRAAGDDEKVIEAMELTVQRLTDKVAEAEAALQPGEEA